jgi:hypothetical protein
MVENAFWENVHTTITVLFWGAEIAHFSALDVRVKEHCTDVAHRASYPPPLQVSIMWYKRPIVINQN